MTAALRSLDPGLRISALGGPALADAGADVIMSADDFAVMGITEAVRVLPAVLRAQRRLGRFLADEHVDLVIPIDFPGFNGRLASRARKLSIPVFWLIAPQVWAWGGWRLGGFRRKVDRLGTILPFETAFFAERGFDVFPMGHPLMEDYGDSFPFDASVAARETRLDDRSGNLTIALLPGSRRQELDHLLPVLKVTIQALVGQLTDRDVHFLVSCAPNVAAQDLYDRLPAQVEVTTEPLPKILKTTDLALVCSGTASLEVALAGVPHDVMYRTGAVNYWLGRRLLRTDYIGLSNLILDKPLAREHLQQQALPLPLTRGLLRWLARPAERTTFYKDVRRLRKLCGADGVWQRTAAAVLDMLPPASGGKPVA